MPNFLKEFVLECDASRGGTGAVLMQKGKPIAFLSQHLKGRAKALSTYEKGDISYPLSSKKNRTSICGAGISS